MSNYEIKETFCMRQKLTEFFVAFPEMDIHVLKYYENVYLPFGWYVKVPLGDNGWKLS